ncbi:alpha/beta fold hydrolase [Streptacidiphilus sp. EB129]|uniref:alpha/beta fold hydrolase n=1 Tax=Streptacidiphilus sp. EB129 TaxID=3156262 RepID=UPI0035136AAB
MTTNASTRLPLQLTTEVSGSGPGILLAHGAAGSVQDNFGPLTSLLNRDHMVVAPSYPATDDSLDLDALADALVESALRAGVEQFTLIGFSLGSTVAVRAAARHPGRVRGLVLAAGFVTADNRLRLAMQLWQNAFERGDHETFARLALTFGFSAGFLNSLPAGMLPGLVGQVAAGVPAGARAQARLVTEVDTTGDLAAITVPTLVVNPVSDLLVDPAGSRFLAQSIAGAQYAEVAAGHVLMAEQTEEWHRLVAEFLTRHAL